MDDRDHDLSELIQKALNENEKLREYSGYAPIYNSNIILHQINDYIKNNSIPSLDDEQRLNVSLLAAKALDFDDRFKIYTLLLHYIWNGFLLFLIKPRAIPLLSDQRKAYDFYLRHGFTCNQIWGHLDGIDFGIGKLFVADFELNQGDIIAQWKALCIPQGNYYTDQENDTDQRNLPDCLGVYKKQTDYLGHESSRIEHRFKLQSDVTVLKSVAAAVLDTWSIKNEQHQTAGGCIQYFNACDKMQFKQVHP